jgi:metal-sulfur cluster biosynthetic enzyme
MDETALEHRAREALSAVLDPEIGINIVDLGLVYAIEASGDRVQVRMTLTSAACPMGDALREEVREALARVLPPPAAFDLELVLEPPWTPSRMSQQARRELGWER